jgi:RNA polymerase sigma-70 factor, ECF subfamily
VRKTLESLEEPALLRSAARGDEEAFETLYRRHQPAIYRYALRMSGSPESADEVVQEVFLAVIRGLNGYRESVGAPGSYLFGMARHLLYRRHGWREVGLEEIPADGPSGSVDPLEYMEQARRLGRLRSAVAALPAHYREVVVLCEMEEMSYQQVAEALGCAVGTIRSRLNRARALLTERLLRPVRVES